MSPAAALKGIIISISILTALSVAVLENPQIQAWLEQQRQKIAELLRSLGEELDPQSRQAAEAFAYEGRTPATDEGLRREASGSLEAAAIATGRSLSNPSTIRRIPIKGPSDPDEAAERKRKGREYLARRNQEMYELQQRRKAAKAESGEGAVTPPTPTSFDAMVDEEGKLRLVDAEKELPSPPASDPVPEDIKAEMREVERNLAQPLLIGEASSSASAWALGSQLANPFSDEYALDRSETPKPPVPPKVALDVDEPHTPTLPGRFTPRAMDPPISVPEDNREELSYEEQLAIAISLSEAEAAAEASNKTASRMREEEDEDDADLRAAIAASLKDMEQRSAKAGPSQLQRDVERSQPLVDLTPPSPTTLHQPAPRGHWETLFNQDYSPIQEPLSMQHSEIHPESEDELYRVTPELTRARLATLDAHQTGRASSSATSSLPYDPVREAVSLLHEPSPAQPQAALEASFYSAASIAPSPASTHTMDHEPTPQLIDVSEEPAVANGAQTPTSRTSFTFETDHESDSETFASISAPASRPQSRPRSEITDVEVLDLQEDSDVDMLSEEGDGIATPDSWTEVGSRDGEDSEMEDERPRQLATL